MLVVSRAEVRDLLDLDTLRVAVGAAMAEVSSGRVSMPWRNIQALSGAMQAPRLRSGTVRIRRMKASGRSRC